MQRPSICNICCRNNTNLNTVQYLNICSGTRTIFLIQQLRGKNLGVRWLIENQQIMEQEIKYNKLNLTMLL
jgi:hypothetical protein